MNVEHSLRLFGYVLNLTIKTSGFKIVDFMKTLSDPYKVFSMREKAFFMKIMLNNWMISSLYIFALIRQYFFNTMFRSIKHLFCHSLTSFTLLLMENSKNNQTHLWPINLVCFSVVHIPIYVFNFIVVFNHNSNSKHKWRK